MGKFMTKSGVDPLAEKSYRTDMFDGWKYALKFNEIVIWHICKLDRADSIVFGL